MAYNSGRFVERILFDTRSMVMYLPVQLIIRNGDLIRSDSNIMAILFVQYDQTLGPHVSHKALFPAYVGIETDCGISSLSAQPLPYTG